MTNLTEAMRETPSGPILHVIVVGFHHKKGCQVEYSFPPLVPGAAPDSNVCPPGWKYLPTLALPDGSHNFDEDAVYFHLPSLTDPKQTIFGISCFRQIPVERLKNRTADITRGTVQKSVCVLSRLPLYGHIQVKMALITHAYFEEGDFSKVKLLHDTYQHLNSCLSELDSQQLSPQLYVGLSARDLVLQFRHKALLLFKLLLLERRLVFYRSPVQPLCATILSLLSLHPGMVEHGLGESACVRPSRPMSPIPEFNDYNNVVGGDSGKKANSGNWEKLSPESMRNELTSGAAELAEVPVDSGDQVVPGPEAVPGDICNMRKAEISIVERQETDVPASVDEQPSVVGLSNDRHERFDAVEVGKEISSNEDVLSTDAVVKTDAEKRTPGTPAEDRWMEVSAGCTHKLRGSSSLGSIALPAAAGVNRDGSAEAICDTSAAQSNMAAVALVPAEQCGVPLPIFTQGYLCHPYLSLPYLDLLSDVNVRGYVVGATNILFKQKKQLADVLVEVEGGRVETQDAELRRQLHLTTEDLRFADFVVRHVTEERHDVFLDGVGWEGGDEWIRAQFRVYLLCLMRTSLLQDGCREAEHFNAHFMAAWKATHNYKMWASAEHGGIWDLNPGHPFAGQLSVQDMKLRLSHTMQNTEGGRKLNQAMASTGRAVATTGRAVGGALSQAKGALSSWWNTFTAPQSPEGEAPPPADCPQEAVEEGQPAETEPRGAGEQ
ncbi:late secretory pathway protein AVL9 homolog [Bacillus rossius redtenbacheri]|uniref:late secretory pathway protein AVL9 homolog n=1 Tax=Bacillus rossius redtenbacheri TaxID=93214 RepID=UPI002FDD48F8